MRLRISQAIIGFLLTTVLCQASLADDAKDWRQYNYDNVGWRFNKAEDKLSSRNVANLEEKWRFPRADAKEKIGVVHGTPVVVNGFVYFGTVRTNPSFYKLTPSGVVDWKYEIESVITAEEEDPYVLYGSEFASDGPMNSPLVHGDRVFFGTFGGQIICLDRFTGALVWRVKTKKAPFPGAHGSNTVMSSPIMADGSLIVAGGGFEHMLGAVPVYPCCTGRGFVTALDPKNGEVRWIYHVGPQPKEFPEPVAMKLPDGSEKSFVAGPSTSSVWCTPSYDEEAKTLYFGTDAHNAPRRPTKDNPRLYNKYSSAIIAISSENGSERWVRQLVTNDIWNGGLPAYDSETNEYKDLSIGDTPKLYSLTIDGQKRQVLGVGCKNGGFYVLDRKTGDIVYNTPTYKGPPVPDAIASKAQRILALPGAIGGLQTGCAFDGTRIYTNGVDWPAFGMSLSRMAVLHAPAGGRVTAIAPTTLSEHWRHERPRVEFFSATDRKTYDSGDPVASGIAVAGDVLFFTTNISGKLSAVGASNGQLLKEFDIGPVWCGPSVSRGRVYVGSGNDVFRPWSVKVAEDSPGGFGWPLTEHGVVYSFGLPGDDEVARLPEQEMRTSAEASVRE